MKHVDTIVLVKDIEASKDFYTNIIGLEILHDWETMVVFKNRFSIHQANKLLPSNESEKFVSSGNQGQNNVIIYFEAENLENEYAWMVEKNVPIIHSIKQLPWQRIFRCYDPDNHIIEIGSPQEG